MSKELEALKRIETTFSMNKQGKESVYREYTNSVYPYYEDFDLVIKALQRLESIEKSNPSTALELVGYLKDHHLNAIPYYDWLNDIEKYILKAQKEHKALEVIKEIIDFDLAEIGGRKVCIYSGNDGDDVVKMVSEEKFNILKEVLEWAKS